MLGLLLDALRQACRQAEEEGLLLYEMVRMGTQERALSWSLPIGRDLVTKGVKR